MCVYQDLANLCSLIILDPQFVFRIDTERFTCAERRVNSYVGLFFDRETPLWCAAMLLNVLVLRLVPWGTPDKHSASLLCFSASTPSLPTSTISSSVTCTTRAAWTADTSWIIASTAASTSSLRSDTGEETHTLARASAPLQGDEWPVSHCLSVFTLTILFWSKKKKKHTISIISVEFLNVTSL